MDRLYLARKVEYEIERGDLPTRSEFELSLRSHLIELDRTYDLLALMDLAQEVEDMLLEKGKTAKR
jgi:hypothetical protein